MSKFENCGCVTSLILSLRYHDHEVLVLSYSKNNYLDKEKCNGTLFFKMPLKSKNVTITAIGGWGFSENH